MSVWICSDIDRGWYAQELIKHWLDLNVLGWKTFGADEYEDSRKVAEEEADTVLENDANRDGKLDIAEYAFEPKGDL